MKDLLLISMLNPNYVVGLVDGEGSFTVYIRQSSKSKTVKRRVLVEPKFYLKLVAPDKKILDELKNFFGCGSVYFQKDKRPRHQDCYRYEVFRRDDLSKIIIPFFRRHPLRLASKRKDFELFCELLARINKGEHMTPAGLAGLAKIKKLMH